MEAGASPGRQRWTDVPPDVVLRMANPIGVPIAFWLGGVIRCFVPGGGI